MMIGLLIMAAVVYQFFFRYEHWPSKDREGVFYEHDNLSGDTYEMKPGARATLFGRIIDSNEPGGRFLEPLDRDRALSDRPVEPSDNSGINLLDEKEVASAAQAVPVPRDVIVATSAPPVPIAMMATDEPVESKPFAIRQVDLNKDGSSEEIIQNAVQSDGLLDISIVKGGREIFFGRGKQVALLPSRGASGWTDIALKSSKGLKVFRYDTHTDLYKALSRSEG
jgi:hypothetical protein